MLEGTVDPGLVGLLGSDPVERRHKVAHRLVVLGAELLDVFHAEWPLAGQKLLKFLKVISPVYISKINLADL